MPASTNRCRADDAGQRDHRAGRQVDAARDDHDGGADRGDAVDRRVLQDQQRVLGVEERVRAVAVRPEVPARRTAISSSEDRDRAQLADVPEPLHDASSQLRASPGASRTLPSPRAPASSPCIRPSRITTMRSASASTSGRSLDTTRHAEPRRRLAADDLVDLELGADVHALGRLVEQQHARPGRQPLGERRPSAGCRRSGCPADASTPAALMRHSPASASASSPLLGRGGSARRRPRCARGSTRLWRSVRLKKRPCRWRSSGTSAMPARAACRGGSRRRAACLSTDTVPPMRAIQAEDRFEQLRPARPDEPEQPRRSRPR